MDYSGPEYRFGHRNVVYLVRSVDLYNLGTG
jgi:hypothetical protein